MMIKDTTPKSEDDASQSLPEAVTLVRLGKKEIYLIGTAHLSQKSVDDVKKTINLVNPDSICVELCPSRYKAMIEKDTWKTMDIFQVIRKGKALLLLAQLIMSSFYLKLGDQLGIQPGAEMLEALEAAKQTDAKLLLADRPIEITLKRIWRSLSFFSKMKMLTQITTGIFELEEIDETLIEEMKQSAQLEDMMEVFAKSFPEIKKRLIDERDAYLAHNIKMAEGEKIVAVVGAGHVNGIIKQFSQNCTLAQLEEVPPPAIWGKVFKWSIPLMIISYPVIGFLQGFQQESLDSITIWFTTHWISAGFATALAFGHPFTIFVAAFVSPLSSLNPLMTAGWFAGLAQAWIKKPTVSDLENVPQAIKTLPGFWKNPATRILLVVLLSNIGSMLGTILSGTWIISRLV